jgi:hypothetical protein
VSRARAAPEPRPDGAHASAPDAQGFAVIPAAPEQRAEPARCKLCELVRGSEYAAEPVSEEFQRAEADLGVAVVHLENPDDQRDRMVRADLVAGFAVEVLEQGVPDKGAYGGVCGRQSAEQLNEETGGTFGEMACGVSGRVLQKLESSILAFDGTNSLGVRRLH